MERRDALVAGVGAVVVALAVVAAAMNAPAAATFAVTVTHADVPVASDARVHTAETVRDTFTFEVSEANATRLVVAARVTFVAGPGALAVMSVLLTAPDGTTYEAEGETRPAGPGEAVAVATVEVPLAEAPENATVEAESAEAAVAAVAPDGNASWVGTWTLDVRAQAGPTPFPRATSAFDATLTTWRLEATAAPPPAK